MRVKFAVLLIAWFGLASVPFAISDRAHPDLAAVIPVTAGLVALLAYFCTRVGYRWFDVAFVLVPVYSVCFQAKILWRVAALPARYWERLGSTHVSASAAGPDRGWHPVPWEPDFFRYWDGRKWGKQIVPAEQLRYGPRTSS